MKRRLHKTPNNSITTWRVVAHGCDVHEPMDGVVAHGCDVHEPKDGVVKHTATDQNG